MTLKLIYNNYIPVKGFLAMTIWPFVFIRHDMSSKFTWQVFNHEKIHTEQQKELLVLFFLVWYGIEYMIRLLIYRNASKAYRNICFEREAYANEADVHYLTNRKHFSFLRYIWQSK